MYHHFNFIKLPFLNMCKMHIKVGFTERAMIPLYAFRTLIENNNNNKHMIVKLIYGKVTYESHIDIQSHPILPIHAQHIIFFSTCDSQFIVLYAYRHFPL